MSMVAAILVSCGTTKTVPITGRSQTLMVSDDQVLSLSFQEYSDYMKTAKPSTNSTNTAMVKRVGQNIAKAVESYLTQNGMAEEVKTYAWEFNLVSDNQLNAFCMPGGKIVVYTGMVALAGNGSEGDSELAAVIGHEVGHAIAKHGQERASQQMLTNIGGDTLSGGSVKGECRVNR